MKFITTFTLLLTLAAAAFAQREFAVRPTETGGPLMPEQAAFDVKHYSLRLKVEPAKKAISGESSMSARVVIPTNVIVLDLDTPYTVSRIAESQGVSPYSDLKWERRGGKIWIWFPMTKQAGEDFLVTVFYSGNPRIAPNPPWVGGFMWEKTP